MDVQRALASDIAMAFDDCTAYPATLAQARESMQRSMRWALRSHDRYYRGPAGGEPPPGHLFGIVQGGMFEDLRLESIETLSPREFAGYAIGGLAVGEPEEERLRVLDFVTPRLPAQRPRYLMGVGYPHDIVAAVARGVDMFDCVMPTRAGRTARAFTSMGIFNLRNARFADDGAPLDPACACPCCVQHSRAYLHHLFKAEEMLGPMLLTWHNVQYYQDLMRGLRRAIQDRRFAAHAEQLRAGWIAPEDIA